MNKGECMNGGYFSLNGLTGFIIAVLLVVSIAIIFSVCAINVQKREATNYYNMDTSKIEMINSANSKYYKMQEKE